VFRGYHHITSTVTSARKDVSFHRDVLGLRLVKKTVLLDGKRPFYHLYYGTTTGEPGSLLTSFVFGPDVPQGRRGSGQVSSVALSVPEGSVAYWVDRLGTAGIQALADERFGEPRLSFEHPDGLRYQLVATGGDDREPWRGSDVPVSAAIRGVHSVTVCTREVRELDYFLIEGMCFTPGDVDSATRRFSIAGRGPGHVIEIDHQPDACQGSWGYMRNTVDHVAFDIGEGTAQLAFKAKLESLGFIDVSEQRDRNYFTSVYVRSPAGAMFEAAWSHPDGFFKDETPTALGTGLQLPEWLEDQADAYMSQLEPID
jgi:glyoxalase family protein